MEYIHGQSQRGFEILSAPHLDVSVKAEQALHENRIALSIDSNNIDALFSAAYALQSLNRMSEALAYYDKFIELKPDESVAYNNRGLVLVGLNKFQEALSSLEKAIEINPKNALAWGNLGRLLQGTGRNMRALHYYDKAVQLDPNFTEAYYNRANVLQGFNQPKLAEQSYAKALALRPDYPLLYGDWLHAKLRACDWTDLERAFEGLAQGVRDRQLIAPPFSLVGTPLSLELQLQCATNYIEKKVPASEPLCAGSVRSTKSRIRLGYFSADFHGHATAYLMAQLFELHDRSKFELVAFSFGTDVEDGMRARLRMGFDQFLELRERTDQDIAKLAHDMQIDIAIDLKGFTAECRPGIFAMRFAPIQVSYLGYPATMGAPYIEYMIADETTIPEQHRRYYSEKIIYLPGSYQPNDAGRYISNASFTREQLALPPDGFVFCCFNGCWKILPPVFDVWMRLLKQVPSSVLWLLADSEAAVRALKDAASARGVDSNRLVFAPRVALPEHLARHKYADLFLDTLPCNAHTTASDALWGGVPVLTQIGETFAGRVAASLVRAAGLSELVVSTIEAYEAMALDLAREPAKLRQYKERLRANRLSCALFDTKKFTTNIESAFTAMWQRYQAGLKPEHIHV